MTIVIPQLDSAKLAMPKGLFDEEARDDSRTNSFTAAVKREAGGEGQLRSGDNAVVSDRRRCSLEQNNCPRITK